MHQSPRPLQLSLDDISVQRPARYSSLTVRTHAHSLRADEFDKWVIRDMTGFESGTEDTDMRLSIGLSTSSNSKPTAGQCKYLGNECMQPRIWNNPLSNSSLAIAWGPCEWYRQSRRRFHRRMRRTNVSPGSTLSQQTVLAIDLAGAFSVCAYPPFQSLLSNTSLSISTRESPPTQHAATTHLY